MSSMLTTLYSILIRISVIIMIFNILYTYQRIYTLLLTIFYMLCHWIQCFQLLILSEIAQCWRDWHNDVDFRVHRTGVFIRFIFIVGILEIPNWWKNGRLYSLLPSFLVTLLLIFNWFILFSSIIILLFLVLLVMISLYSYFHISILVIHIPFFLASTGTDLTILIIFRIE